MLLLSILAALVVLNVETGAIDVKPTPVPAGVCISPIAAKDCSDIREKGFNKTGVYRIQPYRKQKEIQVEVYCDFDTINGDWLVFQRRQDGTVNFEKTYKEYAEGFGDISKEFWIGNNLLHQITSQRRYKLRIDLEDFVSQTRFAEYTTFLVGPASDKYRLTIDGYSGNPGDAMAAHNGQQFATIDADTNDCSKRFGGGGWWFAGCHTANLNGKYLWGDHPTTWADGIEWRLWHGDHYSLKRTEMKISLQD